MVSLERHFPTQLPSNSNEATISDGFGMLCMFDVLCAQSEDGATSISYSFQNPRKVPQEILVPYEPTIPLMPPNESKIICSNHNSPDMLSFEVFYTLGSIL